MVNLAIRGHETRGKEVIEILEMLGGENKYQVTAIRENYVYFMDRDTISFLKINQLLPEQFIVFTLEEFLEKFPYKIGHFVHVPDNEINCYHQDFGDKVRIRLGGDFEIKVEDKLTYIVRKKPQYPKTYCECCDVLQVGFIYELKDLTKDEAELMDYFIGLKRCRDAYWKIAGQQMGLNKPWKPTYETLVDNTYFTIHTFNGKIDRSCTSHRNSILAFPTEEMRDAFFENFKELIEACKEIL